MNLMIVAVAFVSFSAVGNDHGLTSTGVNEIASPAAREAPPAPPAPPANASQASAERLVCRRLVTSGSNRARRVCMTAEQWRQQDR